MKIGILREEKTPPDARVPLTPSQCRYVTERFTGFEVVVQPSGGRCFTNQEYAYQGIALQEDLSDCDILMGVKEVPSALLLPGKTYVFFSHVIKEQPRNRGMMQEVIKKQIRLLDWECMKDGNGRRLIAFGRWAGIVGAYHALRMIGLGTGWFTLRQMSECHNFAEAQNEFEKIEFKKPLKIVLTGTGRVADGAAFLLNLVKIPKVTPHQFCYGQHGQTVYTQLTSADMYYREGQETFDRAHFHQHPQEYKSCFHPFTQCADIMINGIYWDKNIPAFFTADDMKAPGFSIKQIADITCDIAPHASVPSTLRASTIKQPYYGYNTQTGTETQAFLPGVVDIMAIDNLPNELPRDASEDFGNMIISRIIPELLKQEKSEVIQGATIAAGGQLSPSFSYLSTYAGIS